MLGPVGPNDLIDCLWYGPYGMILPRDIPAKMVFPDYSFDSPAYSLAE